MSTAKISLIKACLITCFVFSVMLFLPEAKMSASGYTDKNVNKGKYTSTITYDVDNSCDYGGNYVTVEFKYADDNGSKTTSQSFYGVTARSGKDQTITFSHDDPIIQVDFNIQGDFTHICKYYLKKIETKVTGQIEGCNIPASHTLWEGRCGMKMAPTKVARDGDDPDFNKNYLGIYFWDSQPSVSEPRYADRGSNLERTTDLSKCDLSVCGNPRVVGVSQANLVAAEEIAAPTDDKDLNIELNPGIYYNQYGMKWATQDSTFWPSTIGKSIEMTYKNGKYIMVISSFANDVDDYVLGVEQLRTIDYGQIVRDEVKIKTFDYNFTFLDKDGNEVKKCTADYGAEVTPPDNSNTWVCDAFEDWRNTLWGPQNRNVRSIGELDGSGTSQDPFLIKTSEDWHLLAVRTKSGISSGEYYKLENDISVTEMIGNKENPFEGTFDGNGKTVTVEYSIKSDSNGVRTAPFTYVKNATIKKLTIAGNIKGSSGRAGGLIAENLGNTLIENCIVKVDIEGGDYIGGFCVGAGEALTIENSKFSGKLIGKNECGGFVSYGTNTLIVRNCEFRPVVGTSVVSGATFVNHDYKILENCVFSKSIGTAQGEFALAELEGDGTSANPYLIGDEDDWEVLCYMVGNGNTDGIFFKLVNDISVYSMVGSQGHPFKGVFDGNGKTLTVNYNEGVYYGAVAPFAYIDNATIRNLNVVGSIKRPEGHIAGIVGECGGWSVIFNCASSVTLEGGDYVGGISIGSGGTLLIENCIFDGLINGNNNCGGFVAWGQKTLVIRNCIFAPATGSEFKSGATFANNTYDSIVGCTYYTAIGTVQGDPAGDAYQSEVNTAKKTQIKSFKASATGNKQLKVSWKKNKLVDGYQISYSTDKKFKKSVKKITISKLKTKTTIKKSGKTLYVKIRAYKSIKNPITGKKVKIYSKWSKKIKIKL